MKITTQTVRKYECVLNDEEIKLFKDCLTYVRHRITKHPECGARVIGLEKVNKALLEFEIGIYDQLTRSSI